MAIRIAARLILLLAGLALATALVVGALSALASTAEAEAGPLPDTDQAAAVERTIEAPAPADQPDASPTPPVALVFAGLVLLAALPPAHRIYVYHRPSYHRSDWF
jgi:hypothetical protein